MGQYWYPVNLTKKEFVHPHKLGSGLKLWEQVANSPGVGAALIILTAAMPEWRGGGDLNDESEVAKRTIGRWAGDQIAIVGDYAEREDLPAKFKAESIYNRCHPHDSDCEIKGKHDHFTDITDDVCSVIEHELGGKFVGEGWRDFKRGRMNSEDLRANIEATHGQVWDTEQLQEDFEVLGFGHGFCVVRRKSDGVKGSLDFTHMPRFYYAFEATNG